MKTRKRQFLSRHPKVKNANLFKLGRKSQWQIKELFNFNPSLIPPILVMHILEEVNLIRKITVLTYLEFAGCGK